MAGIRSFEELNVWKMSVEFDKKLYQKTKRLELFQKDFRFKSQILSASGSIMDNIAEDFERDSNKEFIQFLTYSKGSAGEVRSQLYRASHREYIDKDICADLVQEVQKISQSISSFIKYLKSSDLKGRKHKPLT